ncbi:MAG: multidrug ABC transporter ATP-binding protein, partial [Erythrobacter sp.]|nr:multidrug ABC transporter ATP-binding protein [Erythrobacter sp.]
VRALRAGGVTIILTTHYIQEAEAMADRVGVINKGQILLVDEKDAIMAKLGRTEAHFTLERPLAAIPTSLTAYPLHLEDEGRRLVYRGGDGTGRGKREVADITCALVQQQIVFTGLETRESTLEDIFVDLVEDKPAEVAA